MGKPSQRTRDDERLFALGLCRRNLCHFGLKRRRLAVLLFLPLSRQLEQTCTVEMSQVACSVWDASGGPAAKAQRNDKQDIAVLPRRGVLARLWRVGRASHPSLSGTRQSPAVIEFGRRHHGERLAFAVGQPARQRDTAPARSFPLPPFPSRCSRQADPIFPYKRAVVDVRLLFRLVLLHGVLANVALVVAGHRVVARHVGRRCHAAHLQSG